MEKRELEAMARNYGVENTQTMKFLNRTLHTQAIIMTPEEIKIAFCVAQLESVGRELLDWDYAWVVDTAKKRPFLKVGGMDLFMTTSTFIMLHAQMREALQEKYQSATSNTIYEIVRQTELGKRLDETPEVWYLLVSLQLKCQQNLGCTIKHNDDDPSFFEIILPHPEKTSALEPIKVSYTWRGYEKLLTQLPEIVEQYRRTVKAETCRIITSAIAPHLYSTLQKKTLRQYVISCKRNSSPEEIYETSMSGMHLYTLRHMPGGATSISESECEELVYGLMPAFELNNLVLRPAERRHYATVSIENGDDTVHNEIFGFCKSDMLALVDFVMEANPVADIDWPKVTIPEEVSSSAK